MILYVFKVELTLTNVTLSFSLALYQSASETVNRLSHLHGKYVTIYAKILSLHSPFFFFFSIFLLLLSIKLKKVDDILFS